MDKKQLIDEEAIHWFVLLHDEEATDEDRHHFQEWLNKHADHIQAFQEIERLWGGLDFIPDTSKKSAPPKLAIVDSPPDTIRFPSAYIKTHRRWNWQRSMIAASVVLATMIGWQYTPVGVFADYRSGMGEYRVVTLEDGSHVELSSETALNVDFSESRRHVTLVAGEAFFTVMPNPDRPFVVSTGLGDITVLGTAFDVRMGDRVNVAVTQHVVSVHAAKDTDVRVSEGQQVHFGRDGVSSVEAIDPVDIAAWRRNELVFRNTPLEQVISEIQRYRRGHIRIVGDDISKKSVTAVFDTRNPDAALDTITESLGLRRIEIPGVFTVIFAG